MKTHYKNSDCKARTGGEDTVSLGYPVAQESKKFMHMYKQTDKGTLKGTQEPVERAPSE